MKRSKKGFTLVEVLAAAIILAIISVSIVFSISFSKNMVQANSNDDAYAAEAQAAADSIITFVNSGITSGASIEAASRSSLGQQYQYSPGDYSTTSDAIQFKINQSTEDTELYKIKVKLFYGPANDRKSAGFMCYAHANW